jgi:outer membrane receptor protein involved in Fe transport
LSSAFDADTVAAFAQIDGAFAGRWRWSFGLRQETRKAEYEDAGNWGGDPNRITRDNERRDSMWGGNGSLTLMLSERTNGYAGVARGYKAGGFNLGSARATQAEFEPEYLWNYELGVKTLLSDWLYVDVVAFYMDREDVQVRSGRQLIAGDPNSFVFFTANAADGKNYGVEGSFRWAPNDALVFGGSLGLLRTSVAGLIDGDGNPLPERDQAHAPNYQVQLNATWRGLGGWMARIDAFAQDDFYFDMDHNQQSESYGLMHLRVGYEAEQWSVHGWVRNAFDESYATRGFHFGNEPPDFAAKLYVQNGDPRTVGVSASWSLR